MVTAAPGAGAAQPWLPRAIRALEVGDCATARRLSIFVSADEGADAVQVAASVRIAAGAMAARCSGDVAAAERQYQDATAALPSWVRQAILDGRLAARRLATVPAAPRRAALVLWREQQLIADLRIRLDHFTRARDHLVEACIEYAVEIEFTPFTWQLANNTRFLPSVTPTRKDLCARATRLRRLTSPRSGDVTESVWKDVMGYRGLRALAMARLADRPLVPWSVTVSRMLPEPVRRGHRRAWDYAQTLRGDLHY